MCSAALPPDGGANFLLDSLPLMAVWLAGGNQTYTPEKHVHKNQKHCDTLINGPVICRLVDCGFNIRASVDTHHSLDQTLKVDGQIRLGHGQTCEDVAP